jgi:hypothetical protein
MKKASGQETFSHLRLIASRSLSLRLKVHQFLLPTQDDNGAAALHTHRVTYRAHKC